MNITVEATYENGALKLAKPLPLREQEKVTVTVSTEKSWVERTYGMMGWTGDHETIRRIAEDDEFGIEECP